MRYIENISQWVGTKVSWIIIALTGIVAYDVIVRYVFDKATLWAFDTAILLFSALFLLGAAYTHYVNSHIRVDVIFNQFPPRGQAIASSFFYIVLFFPLLVLLTWTGTKAAIQSWAVDERSVFTPLLFPIYPVKTIPPIAFLLFLLQGIVDFARNIKVAVKGSSS
jgi:TRAP-type mannitol/chloroaromatic compound transport system permease small subunit